MTSIMALPAGVSRQKEFPFPSMSSSVSQVDAWSLDTSLESQLMNFLEKVRQWYDGKVENGRLRLSLNPSSDGQILDFWYQGAPPDQIEMTTDTIRIKDSNLKILRDDKRFVEGIRTASGDFSLTARLTNNENLKSPKWGSWCDSLESVSGDLWGYWHFGEADVFMISDGLGHGKNAAEASRRAASIIEEQGDKPLDAQLELIHKKLQATRGAVIFLGRLPHDSDTLEYCSIGNISVRVIGETVGKSLVSFNGTVGFGELHAEVLTLDLEVVNQIILHTDGVEQSSNGFYDSVFRDSSPVLNAARLLKNFRKGSDDALVGVIDC